MCNLPRVLVLYLRSAGIVNCQLRRISGIENGYMGGWIDKWIDRCLYYEWMNQDVGHSFIRHIIRNTILILAEVHLNITGDQQLEKYSNQLTNNNDMATITKITCSSFWWLLWTLSQASILYLHDFKHSPAVTLLFNQLITQMYRCS